MTPENFAAEHGTALLRLATMLTGNAVDADDLVQETFVGLLRGWSGVERADTPRAYARRALVNTHLTRRRRAGREVLRAVPDGPAPAPSRGSDTDAAWALLAELPRQQRAVLVLRYYEDLPDAEIAQVMGISAGSVRTHAARGLAALRTAVPTREVLS